MIDLRVAANIHDDLLRGELPFRARQFACGDGPIGDDVMVRSGFFDHSSVKKEWIGTGQDVVVVAELHANGAGHVLEFSDLALQVVFAASGFDVFIIRSALKNEVSLGLSVSRIFVIGNLVRREPVHSIKNSDFAL